jgi:hypothetical protein
MKAMRECNHIQGVEPRNGIITIEVHDTNGNRLELEHVSIWDDRKSTTIPRISLTVKGLPA